MTPDMNLRVSDGRQLEVPERVVDARQGQYELPYVMIDSARSHDKSCSECLLLLHPDDKEAAVVTVKIAFTGQYKLDATFARANDKVNAGNGVRVVTCKNRDFGHPLFDDTISSKYEVDLKNLFSGKSKRQFLKTVSLRAGGFLQFAVFAAEDPRDPAQTSRGFDLKALQVNISLSNVTKIVLPNEAKGVWH